MDAKKRERKNAHTQKKRGGVFFSLKKSFPLQKTPVIERTERGFYKSRPHNAFLENTQGHYYYY